MKKLTALLLFSSFTTVFQLYCWSPALLLFSSLFIVLEFYNSSPALLLFWRTAVKLKNNSKA
jgi:hypothetical protein